MDISEAEVTALEAEGESLVIDAQLPQDGRMEIVHVDRVFHDVVAKVIRLAMGHLDGVKSRMCRKSTPAPPSLE